MSIVGGLDFHRKQLTFDWVDEQNDKWERGRISPADREHLADWLTRFDPVVPGRWRSRWRAAPAGGTSPRRWTRPA